MNVCIIGTGYVGLVSGVCLASKGHNVIGVDSNADIVGRLNKSEPTIYEDGLLQMLQEVVASKKFRATTNLTDALRFSDIAIVAVGTPFEGGSIDLSSVSTVAQSIGSFLNYSERFLSIVIKSTVVPGTTDTFVKGILDKTAPGKTSMYGLGMNPEFLREGVAIQDFLEPDRIVIGSDSPKTLEHLNLLYEAWNVEKLVTNSRTAELIKYASNFFLATQISAANEIGNLGFEIGGIETRTLFEGIHLDRRWSPLRDGVRVRPEILTYLRPGCGFGGSCFPKDVQAISSEGRKRGLAMSLTEAVLAINDRQPHEVLKRLTCNLDQLSCKRVLVLGLAFKPGTDDVRESPAVKIISDLVESNALVTAHDPVASSNFFRSFGRLSNRICITFDWEALAEKSDVIVLVTPWPEYNAMVDMDLADTVVVDCRGVFQKLDKCKKLISF